MSMGMTSPDIPELKNRALGFRAYYKTGIWRQAG